MIDSAKKVSDDGDPFDGHLMAAYNHLLTMDKEEIDRRVANCFNVFL